MESLMSVITLMQKDCYMASIDLKDAYYSVPIASQHQKYLKFIWKEQLYQFTCLPNGLACAPRIFTKLLKPVYSHLRNTGYLSAPYIDDSYLQGDTLDECYNNVEYTYQLLSKLGFTPNDEKSVMIPTQRLVFLGFLLDSHLMEISLTLEKAQKLINSCQKLLETAGPTIRDVAHVVGLMVASFPGNQFGPLYYRNLEMAKIKALKNSHGNFDAVMSIPNDAKMDLQWWTTNIVHASKPVSHDQPKIWLQSDASKKGWGVVNNNASSGGQWSTKESMEHINFLELKAAFFAIKAFCTHYKDIHVRIEIDNTTAVA
ncbi:uncharacterized protein LOC144435531 [Glandiceps talaboti]